MLHTANFKQNEVLKDKAVEWHLKDISKLSDKASQLNREQLKGLAHLGRIGGMGQCVLSKGQYKQKDPLGASLQSYYNQFVSFG